MQLPATGLVCPNSPHGKFALGGIMQWRLQKGWSRYPRFLFKPSVFSPSVVTAVRDQRADLWHANWECIFAYFNCWVNQSTILQKLYQNPRKVNLRGWLIWSKISMSNVLFVASGAGKVFKRYWCFFGPAGRHNIWDCQRHVGYWHQHTRFFLIRNRFIRTLY